MKNFIKFLGVFFVLLSLNTFAQNATLYWQFANAQYSNGEYTFDIEIRSSDANTYLNGAGMQISYDQGTFADPVEADITINPTFDSGFWLSTITINNDGTIIVSTFDLFNAGALIPQEPDAFLNFCTVTLDVTNPCNEVGIAFNEAVMNGQSTYVPSNIYVNSYVNDWTNENTGYSAPATTTWSGSTDADWYDADNWSDGIPCTGSVVTIPDVTNYPIVDANGYCSGVTINPGGKLTVESGVTLDVDGGFTIESDASGNGSFINDGTLNSTSNTVGNYLTTGDVYHGISMPVSGETSSAFMGAPSNVYLKYYNTATNDYTNITDYGVALNVGQGYMIKVASGSYTPTYTGPLNTGASVTLNTTGLGFNFIGNPFTSAINWNASSGWTGKGNTDGTIWVYNNGTFETYNASTDGEVAMNQGFFVKATSSGTLSMNNDVCVHDDVAFKNSSTVDQRVKIQVQDLDKVDNFMLAFVEGATTEFDWGYDGRKMFTFNEDHPQIYSTMNDNLAINALPVDYRENIPMDVKAVDGNSLTISAIETGDFSELYLLDEHTGIVTDLVLQNYTFTHSSDITDRFTILFSVTDIEDNDELAVKVYGYNNNIKVYVDAMLSTDITVTNLLGQTVAKVAANSTETIIPVNETGIYVVTVSNENGVMSEKVFIK